MLASKLLPSISADNPSQIVGLPTGLSALLTVKKMPEQPRGCAERNRVPDCREGDIQSRPFSASRENYQAACAKPGLHALELRRNPHSGSTATAVPLHLDCRVQNARSRASEHRYRIHPVTLSGSSGREGFSEFLRPTEYTVIPRHCS